MTTDVSGRTGILVGANGGVAFEAARMLLAHNISRLVLTVRNPDRFDKDVAPLKEAYPSARIEVWPLDLLSYESIQSFVKRSESLDRIDFINISPGMMLPRFEINKSTGHEMAFQVNYLSVAYLSLLLLPVLRTKRPEGEPSHLSLVSSGLIYVGKFPEQKCERLFSAFDDPKNFSVAPGKDRYTTAKIMLLMFVLKIKEYVSADEVIINATDPGFMKNSGLDRNMPWVMRPLGQAMRYVIGRPTKGGAVAYIDASVIKGKNSHGSFLYNWTIAP